MLSLNCFVDLSISERYRSWEIYYELSVNKACTWPVAPVGEVKFPDTVIIGGSALYPLAKGAIQMLLLLLLNADYHS